MMEKERNAKSSFLLLIDAGFQLVEASESTYFARE